MIKEDLSDGDLASKTLLLTDFGLAREFTHSMHVSTPGTYAWTAPEVIKEQKFSLGSDVWR